MCDVQCKIAVKKKNSEWTNQKHSNRKFEKLFKNQPNPVDRCEIQTKAHKNND